MIFNNKPTSEFQPQDIEDLISSQIQENQFLDFKAIPYKHDDDGTYELIKDFCGLANAMGGYVFIGIAEDGERRAANINEVPNPEAERKSIIDRCLERIEPRLPRIDISCIQVRGKTILVCHIEESHLKPHLGRPKKEQHFFWRRYEDVNKLMSYSDIQEEFQRDLIFSRINEIKRHIESQDKQSLIIKEKKELLEDGRIFEIQTEEIWNEYTDKNFLDAIGTNPFYRLTSTFLPVNGVQLINAKHEIESLMQSAPQLRQNGWDVSMTDILIKNSNGIFRENIEYKHLRIFWNGQCEFWVKIDDSFFRIYSGTGNGHKNPFLYPYALIEPIANFIELIRRLIQISKNNGTIENVCFKLYLQNIKGYFLAPYAPNIMGYSDAIYDAGHKYGPQPFGRERLIIEKKISIEDFPSNLLWELVAKLYHNFGYSDDQIPFFDESHILRLSGMKS
ncbi:MAG: ATP-binding protein [Candidatus Aminicenantes bacterium]|nr:ATP-binding protein [Candidatus Aminicenantes bacterium]